MPYGPPILSYFPSSSLEFRVLEIRAPKLCTAWEWSLKNLSKSKQEEHTALLFECSFEQKRNSKVIDSLELLSCNATLLNLKNYTKLKNLETENPQGLDEVIKGLLFFSRSRNKKQLLTQENFQTIVDAGINALAVAKALETKLLLSIAVLIQNKKDEALPIELLTKTLTFIFDEKQFKELMPVSKIHAIRTNNEQLLALRQKNLSLSYTLNMKQERLLFSFNKALKTERMYEDGLKTNGYGHGAMVVYKEKP